MKILFVCHRFPFPPNRGGKIRPFKSANFSHLNHLERVDSKRYWIYSTAVSSEAALTPK